MANSKSKFRDCLLDFGNSASEIQDDNVEITSNRKLSIIYVQNHGNTLPTHSSEVPVQLLVGGGYFSTRTV